MTSPARLRSDTERLQALAARSGGRIVLLASPQDATRVVVLDLHYAIAASARYPQERRTEARLRIALPARYPFQPPQAAVATPVWHPNVFESGTVCIGGKWLPSEGLDQFVERLVRLLTFDPLLVNAVAPANHAAAAWYERALRLHPDAFPTDRVELSPERVLRKCPFCHRSLRLPRERRGHVRCPACGEHFEAST
jgi:ubiquitin-protein ligase